jgi:hypothetical protein
VDLDVHAHTSHALRRCATVHVQGYASAIIRR